MSTSKETYERKQKELLEKCSMCTCYNSPTLECCKSECDTGKELQQLNDDYKKSNQKTNKKD